MNPCPLYRCWLSRLLLSVGFVRGRVPVAPLCALLGCQRHG
jgi:hypothetical protein